MPSGMKAVKSVDGLIRIVSFLANQQVLLPTTVGSKVQNNVPLSTVNNQKAILLHTTLCNKFLIQTSYR